jgi:hypothetical protein
MSGPPDGYDYLDDLDLEPDEDEDGFDDCGLRANGTCSLAGTEYCDWDCTFTRVARHNRRHVNPKPLPLFDGLPEKKS